MSLLPLVPEGTSCAPQPACFAAAMQMRLMRSAKLWHPLTEATRGLSAMNGLEDIDARSKTLQLA